MRLPKISAESTSALTMLALSLFMAPFVFMLASRARPDALTVFGFREPLAETWMAWVAGVALAAAYIAYCVRIPSVKRWLVRPHTFKLIALILAVLAGTLEEIAFRKMLMDWMERSGGGAAIQIIVSGVSFGLMHIVWGGLKGSWVTAFGSVVATTVLGLGLAVVYLIGDRNLAPCIVAHFLVTASIEPGLLIAAFGGGMGRQSKATAQAAALIAQRATPG
jgi:membrane protease YdiL (CAAX protease family)